MALCFLWAHGHVSPNPMLLCARIVHAAHQHLPSEVWSLPAPSSTKLEERTLVVDSGASMHMLSRSDLSSTELETVRVYRIRTTVITANGAVQTSEKATVYATIWIYS